MNISQLKNSNEQFKISSKNLITSITKTVELEPESNYRIAQIVKYLNECRRKLYKIEQSL